MSLPPIWPKDVFNSIPEMDQKEKLIQLDQIGFIIFSLIFEVNFMTPLCVAFDPLSHGFPIFKVSFSMCLFGFQNFYDAI